MNLDFFLVGVVLVLLKHTIAGSVFVVLRFYLIQEEIETVFDFFEVHVFVSAEFQLLKQIVQKLWQVLNYIGLLELAEGCYPTY